MAEDSDMDGESDGGSRGSTPTAPKEPPPKPQNPYHALTNGAHLASYRPYYPEAAPGFYSVGQGPQGPMYYAYPPQGYVYQHPQNPPQATGLHPHHLGPPLPQPPANLPQPSPYSPQHPPQPQYAPQFQFLPQNTVRQQREPSAAPSESEYEASNSETGSQAESVATGTIHARPNKRRRAAELTAGQWGGGGPSMAGPSTRAAHEIPDKMVLECLQTQYAQISDKLERITANMGTPAPQAAHPLLQSEEVLQQVIKGYQETNAILREGLRLQSAQAEAEVKVEGQEQMDVDPTGSFPLPGTVKRAPEQRSKASKAVARIVREYFKDVFKGNEEDRAVVRGYKPNEGPPCTIENFRLDLHGPPCGVWNKAARKVFIKGLLETKAEALSSYKPTTKTLENLFVSNFKNARAKLKWARMPEPRQELIKQAHRQTERKRWLYFRRLQAAERFEDTRRHIPMIAAYGWEGMSTDESDHENDTGGPDYGVLNKPWRHPNASACLRTLDCLHRDSRFKKNRRVTAGAHPHQRSLCNKLSLSPAVPKLPSALYDPTWLARQPDIVKEDLEIIDSPEYDFSHTAAIQDLSRVNNGKKDSIYPYA
ncbi:hypothetical protein MD484_g8539, partial [Candolleomyces efflorescens]